MSLNFNGPGELPIIREAQNMMNNGGGGNLGYFQGRRKKKNSEIDIFKATDEEDTFSWSSDDGSFNGENYDTDGASVADKIKGFFNKFKK